MQLQHTTISPLARILKAAAYTLTTGDLYTLIHSTIRKSTTIWNIDIYPTVMYKLQMIHGIRPYSQVLLTIRTDTNNESFQRMFTRHSTEQQC